MINISDISLIQEIRAIHALSELGFNIYIEKSDNSKFQLLKEKFNMAYIIGHKDGLENSSFIRIDHSKPNTSITSVTKPLIFPKSITNYLKSRWGRKRKYEFGFAGLVTPEREKVIEKWLLNNYKKAYRLKDVNLLFKLKRKLFIQLEIDKPLLKKFSNLYISSNNRGRLFPGKSWDDDYYDFMLKSKFILCPSGVYIWTYRFFESILCGAIPVIEEYSPCYEDFIYYDMNEKVSNMKWSQDIVEHNYNLCLERITLSERDILKIKKGTTYSH